jgi:ATP-dependent DNA helicase RecG
MTFRTSATSELSSVPSATIDDLDLDAFEDYLRQHVPRLAADDVPLEDALLRLRLGAMTGKRLVPTVAGLYLFGVHPQLALPQLGIVAAAFDGRDITAEIATRSDIDGPLSALLEQGLQFVRECARELVNQVDPESSTLEFPTIAVREALVNALVHRDVRAGGRVALRLYEDRLEIWSPGPASGLPNDISTYVKRGGVSLPRNPLIAVVARQLGHAEQLGRGLPLMRRTVTEEVHGELQVSGTKDGVLVTIPSALEMHSTRADPLAN